jgi:predicted alpha/beta hydrolase family esterase
MRAADADILILPGLNDSEPDHWQSRWLQKLSSARKVEQVDFGAPRLADWRPAIERAVEESARPTVVVAHSLGVVALLHAAQRVGDKIAGAFLVAPPSQRAIEETPAIAADFLPYPRARVPFKATLIAGTDDPFSEPGFAKALAEDIGAAFLDAGASGHINLASGHGPWPEGSMVFAQFLSKL